MPQGGANSGEVMELARGQETELPQALKWQLVRPDEEYGAATVEACRVTVEAAPALHRKASRWRYRWKKPTGAVAVP